MTTEHHKKILDVLCSCKGDEIGKAYFKELQQKGDELKDNEIIEELSKFLNAIANKDRLIILKVVKERETCVCELEAILDKSQPNISHHLKKLEVIGLIRGWKKGRFTYYDLMRDKFNEKLELLLNEIKE
jgi:ArsR family transcriptional regulator